MKNDDLISRQAAIDAIDEIESEIAEGCGVEYEKWRKYFCDLPSAQPEQQWIPCNVRLPRVADCYAVTRQIGSDLIVSACYFDGINNWHDDNWINHERNYLTDIVAWLPLPEPYKEEEQDG